MICSQCGMENKDSAKFCKNCGNPLTPKPAPVNNVQSNPSYSNNAGSGDNSNKKLLLICVTLIICIAIVAAAFVLAFNGGNSDSYNNADSGSNSAVSDSSSNGASSSSASQQTSYKNTSPSSDIYIKFCDFYTGSSSSDKSYCSANIGTEHTGEKYKISVLYSDNGRNLNDGATATKTVDEEGFLHIYTSNAFDVYPDKAIVDIYDANGNFLTEKTYHLEETSGQQKFDH